MVSNNPNQFPPREAGTAIRVHFNKPCSMKTKVIIGMTLLASGLLTGAEPGGKEEVAAAGGKLAQQPNYSWKSSFEAGNFSGSTTGKAEKDGVTSLSISFGDNTTEAFLQGAKGAVKSGDQDWQSLADLAANTEAGPRRFMLRRLQNFKAPAVESSDLANKTKELKKEGEAYSGDLTEEGAKELLLFGRRGSNAPEPKNAKGSVKFWLKDGMLSKYELKLQGTVNFNGEDRDIDRTTTTEIKDVGTTKISIPEAAKAKIG